MSQNKTLGLTSKVSARFYCLITAGIILGILAVLILVFIASSEVSTLAGVAICIFSIGLLLYFTYLLYAVLHLRPKDLIVCPEMEYDGNLDPAYDSGTFKTLPFSMGQVSDKR